MNQGRAIALLFAGIAFASTTGLSSSAVAKDFPAVPGEFVVKMKSTMTTQSVHSLARVLNTQKVQPLSPESQSYLITRPAVETAGYSVAALNQVSGVEYAEPNHIYSIVGHATAAPNDAKFGDLWGMVNTGQLTKGDAAEGTVDVKGVPGTDINAMAAWMVETGSPNIKVAVIDTGVDYTLADMKDNVWTNEVELNGKKGVDDDANGCIDDIHGCNFSVTPATGDPLDDHGHGTHVSGTIGAKGNNGVGVVGVAWNTSIVGVKFLTASGTGTLAGAVQGIDYARKVGVKIMSNSWGGGGEDQSLKDAITRARDAGILFVAAAGNDGTNNDSYPTYPASYKIDNIISVAALDAAGNLADFSCYGATSVHVAAPGVNVPSNVPVKTDPSGFATWSGTSMATPHVSGVAALVLSHNPNLTYSQLKNAIVSTTHAYPSLKGKTISGGMVDALAAINAGK